MKFNLRSRLAAEFLGTAFLVAAVIGSGIMGERLAGGNVAIALLANTIATGAALVALILTFGPISGAHLNPAVTLADAIEHGIPWTEAAPWPWLYSSTGRSSRSDRRASDVRPTMVLTLHTFPAWVDAGSKRVRGNIRTLVRHLGMFPTTLGSGAVRGCKLHHRRLLVYRVNLFCEPGSDNRPLLVRHFCWDSAVRCSPVHRGTTGRSLDRHSVVSAARPGLVGTRGRGVSASPSETNSQV